MAHKKEPNMSEKLREELTALPARIAALPVHRGYPVPFFVATIDGQPEFRVMSGKKWTRAVKERLCWVCGQPLGVNLCFVLGPMCGINRTTSEPPCHRECARWSAVNCPFLTRPHMVRREAGMPESSVAPGGLYIDRNPGVTLLWVTRTFEPFKAFDGNWLLGVGDPLDVEWYAEGRPATYAEVEAAVETGFPALLEVAKLQEHGVEALNAARAAFDPLMPAREPV